MLGKTTTFFNRNRTVLQTAITKNHTRHHHLQPPQNHLEITIVAPEKKMNVVNVAHVMMIFTPPHHRRRADEKMIAETEIGMIIIEGIGIEREIVTGGGMMIEGSVIDIGMRGDGRRDAPPAGRDREVGVGVDRLEDRQIIGVAGREVRKAMLVVLLHPRSMRGRATKWRIWKS